MIQLVVILWASCLETDRTVCEYYMLNALNAVLHKSPLLQRARGGGVIFARDWSMGSTNNTGLGVRWKCPFCLCYSIMRSSALCFLSNDQLSDVSDNSEWWSHAPPTLICCVSIARDRESERALSMCAQNTASVTLHALQKYYPKLKRINTFLLSETTNILFFIDSILMYSLCLNLVVPALWIWYNC